MIIDAKHAIYKLLKEQFDSLHSLYPDKIDVKVTTAYPRTVEQIDRKAIITISRVSNQEEYKFISDQVMTEEVRNNSYASNKGNLQTDIFEIAIWTLDAQYRDDLYLLTRQLLFENKHTLYSDYGFIKWYRIGGSDQELDIAKLPRTVYRGVLNYLAMTRMTLTTLTDLVSSINVTLNILPSGGSVII